MLNDFEPRVGHRFRFMVDPMPGYSGVTECEVLEVDPPSRLVYTWAVVPKGPAKPRPPAMTLTWTLVPEVAGTRLRLHQTGAETLNWWWRFSMDHGWNRMLRKLMPKVLGNVRDGRFTPGAIRKRDFGTRSVPAGFAK